MYYRLKENVALRKWKLVERAIYIKGIDHALSVSKEDFETLLKCDGQYDLELSSTVTKLINLGYIEECQRNDKINNWSLFKEYDNYYFPKMNLMLTGKCNLNCLHCFNAKDNTPLNSELTYEQTLNILDQARDIGIHAFTLTGGEPLVHPRFLDIVKEIYKRDLVL